MYDLIIGPVSSDGYYFEYAYQNPNACGVTQRK